jgi:hypothetical protein
VQDRVRSSEEVERARQNLVGMGLTSTNLENWTPLHIVVLDEYMQYEKMRDDVYKWVNLPYYKARIGLESLAKQSKSESNRWPILNMLPAVEKVKRAQARFDQRIAYLQVLEAIRLHAFNNDGNLPKTLDEIKLPVPVDPVTGKQFEYSVEKGVATLHGQNAGDAPETNRYYIIMLAK